VIRYFDNWKQVLQPISTQ